MTQNVLRSVRISILAAALGTLALPSVSYAQNAPDQPAARQNRAARPARAQGQRGGGQGQMAQRFQQILEQLDLSSDQKEKIRPIMEDFRTKAREAMQNSADPEQRRDQMRQAMADMRKKIGEVLTPEQKTKLQELMREQRAAAATQPARAGGAGGGVIGRIEEAALSLNLTAEQQTQVKDLSKEYQDEVAAIIKSSGGAGGAGGAGGQGARAGGAGGAGGAGQDLRKAVQEYRSRLTQLLTPEQTEQFNKKLEEMRGQMGGDAAGVGQRQGGRQGRARARAAGQQ